MSFPLTQPSRSRFTSWEQNAVDLPDDAKLGQLRYAKRKGFSAVALPYGGGDLQFVVLIPDEVDGLGELEKQANSRLFWAIVRK